MRIARFGLYPTDSKAFWMKQTLDRGSLSKNIGFLSQSDQSLLVSVTLLILSPTDRILFVKTPEFNNLYTLPIFQVDSRNPIQTEISKAADQVYGSNVTIPRFVGIFEYTEEESLNQKSVGLVYSCRTKSEPQHVEDQSEDSKWMSIEETARLPLLPQLRDFLLKLPSVGLSS